MVRLPVLAVSIALLACGGGDEGGGADPGADAASEDSDLPATCADSCAQLSVEVEFGTVRTGFSAAYYGVTAEDGTLHIEVHGGRVIGCPTAETPPPPGMLVIGSVPAPTSTEPLDESHGVSVALIDLTGEVITMPVAKASAGQLVPVAGKLSGADGFLAFDLNATFDGGTARGHVYAIHCDSLDQ